MSAENSAVLQLKDDSDELDGVPTSKSVPTSKTADGAEVGAPLIMEDGYDIAVKVDNPIKQLSTLETFVTYRVRCVCARWPSPPYVRRRYNHFKVFHKRISSAHPLLAIPPLPPHHSALEQLDRYEQNFVALRTLALHAFLDRIAKHPILTHSEELRLFVTTSESEADREFRSESALWGLPVFGARENRTVGTQRVKDPEFSGALDYLNSLQQKLTTLHSLTNKLNKGTNFVGAEMAGLSTACSSWSGLVSRGAASCAAARRLTRLEASPLPFLAAYAAALAEKVTQRNHIHATHVSGNATEDVHNKLLQASESLRSDLADWTPKTRNDIKKTLLNMAENQINIHKQTFQAWEQALKEATAKTPEDLFKTVSKTAVQNLSPMKCKKIDDIDIEAIDNHTEQDIEEFDLDSDIQELSLNETSKAFKESKVNSFEGKIEVEIHNYEENCLSVNSDVELNNGGEGDAHIDIFESINDVYNAVNNTAPVSEDFKTKCHDRDQSIKVTTNDNNSNLTKTYDNLTSFCDDVASKSDNLTSKSDNIVSKSDNIVSQSDIKPEMSEQDARTLENIFENQFLDINSEKDVSEMSVQSNLDSTSKDLSAKLELKGVNATSDPLTDFTDIDLHNT